MTPVLLRTRWICPICTELQPTRHWSVGRHIIRKHAGRGEPISINTHLTRNEMIRSGMLKPTSPATSSSLAHFGYGTNNQIRHTSLNHHKSFSSENNRFAEEPPTESPLSPSREGILDGEYFEFFRRSLEMKNLQKQNQHSFTSNLQISIANAVLQGHALVKLDPVTVVTLIQSIFSRNVGVRGRLCRKCSSYWLDLVNNDMKQGMKTLILQKPASHQCEPQKVQDQDLEGRKNKSLEGLNKLLISFLWPPILLQQLGLLTIQLNIEELESTALPSWVKEEECIKMGNSEEKKEDHWTFRAFKDGARNKSIFVDGDELIDFIMTVKATFGVFEVHMDGEPTRYIAVYLNLGSDSDNFGNRPPLAAEDSL